MRQGKDVHHSEQVQPVLQQTVACQESKQEQSKQYGGDAELQYKGRRRGHLHAVSHRQCSVVENQSIVDSVAHQAAYSQ